jgi:hypothetical protein
MQFDGVGRLDYVSQPAVGCIHTPTSNINPPRCFADVDTRVLFVRLLPILLLYPYLKMDSSSLTAIFDKHRPDLAPYEDLYRHLHANPELSTQEKETAQLIADHLSRLSSDLDIRTSIGGHGLVAVLKNGSGKTVLLRADIDGLPVGEKTGLAYASKKMKQDVDGVVKPVMHGKSLRVHARRTTLTVY